MDSFSFFSVTIHLETLYVIATSVGTLIHYWLFDHGYLGAQALRSFNKESRKRWVNAILNQQGTEILAVQVLRNSIMSATVMASTCILLVIATMSLISDPDKFAAHWIGSDVMHSIWKVKVASLLLTIFLSFWHYAQSIRIYGHVGYIVGMPKINQSGQLSGSAKNSLEESATALLNTAGHMFSVGNRAFFYSLALALWWIGFSYFIVGVLSLTFMSWLLERRALAEKTPL